MIDLEAWLGDPLHPDARFSFRRAVELDEREAFPAELLDLLFAWGFHDYMVPTAVGGKLSSFEEVLHLLRAVSRRDLTTAIAMGKTFLGSVVVWLFGTPSQQEDLARMVAQRDLVSLGLTEREHGSDLLAGEVVATEDDTGFVLRGEKWLINNATMGRAATVLARTHPQGGPRGFTVLLFDKQAVPGSGYQHLPKVRTHGIRGADISGVAFSDCRLPRTAVVGARGRGVDLVVKSLQVTRTMCAGLSLGAAEAGLRLVAEFARTRRLYGATVLDIPHARRVLATALADLWTLECVALAGVRGLHLFPEKMSVWSAVVKYLVPTRCERILHDLGVVLGARYYLRQDHAHGMFQKMLRDNAVVPLFDGSTVINLYTLGTQLGSLARGLERPDPLPEGWDDLFALAGSLPPFRANALDLSAQGIEPLVASTVAAVDRLRAVLRRDDTAGRAAACLLAEAGRTGDEVQRWVAACTALTTQPGWTKSPELFDLAEEYCGLFARLAVLWTWLVNRDRLGGAFARGEWLALALRRLSSPPRTESSTIDAVIGELSRRLGAGESLSLAAFPLGTSGGRSSGSPRGEPTGGAPQA